MTGLRLESICSFCFSPYPAWDPQTRMVGDQYSGTTFRMTEPADDRFVAMTEIVAFNDSDVERYADVLAKTVAAVARGGLAAGALELQPIAGEIWMGRLAASREVAHGGSAAGSRLRDENLRAQVFIRDRFRCTCCGGRAVPRSILVAIHDLFPEQVPYDAHYTRGKIHPVFWALAPEADHVVAHSRGGLTTIENLTTLHAACNTRKSDSIAADMTLLQPILATGDWDGLTSFYPTLIAAGAGTARPAYHRSWSRRYVAPST